VLEKSSLSKREKKVIAPNQCERPKNLIGEKGKFWAAVQIERAQRPGFRKSYDGRGVGQRGRGSKRQPAVMRKKG